ncbi:MAG: NAD-dependent epimerase/dehydratase family protein [Bacteroidota bacterium]
MRTLLTGATGFIGKHLVKVWDDQKSPQDELIALTRRKSELRGIDGVKIIDSDLEGSIKNRIDFSDVDNVIHLAWDHVHQYKSELHLIQTLGLQIRFLNYLLENGVNNLTIAGTCFEYGLIEGCLSEKIVTNPVTAYGMAKDVLRKYLFRVANESASIKWLRLFYVYGEGQYEHSLLPSLNRAIQMGNSTFDMSSGDQLRDFIEVKKVAEIIYKLSKVKVREIINVGSGEPIAIKEFVVRYLSEVHPESKIHLNLGAYPYSSDEPRNFWANLEKMSSQLEVVNEG